MSACALRARLQLHSNLIGNVCDFSRLKKLYAPDRASMRPAKANAYMVGSPILGVKRKVAETDKATTVAAKRVKKENAK